MRRSPFTALKEGDITSAADETLQFDDDNLRGRYSPHAFYSLIHPFLTYGVHVWG